MDDRAAEQLAALREITALLDGAAVEYWLFGGWAVDFHAGFVTRRHFDLDLAVWLEDVPRIATILDARGWRHAPDPDEDGGTGYERNGVRLELTFLVRRDSGVFLPLRGRDVPWPKESLGSDRRELLGVRARVIALPALLRSKSSPRDDPDDGPKDVADAAVLRRLGWRERVRSLLEAPSPAVLTTYRQDGNALVSPVWFRWSGKAFEVVIAEDDVKLRHLARDRRCTLVVFETVPPFRGVEAGGEPELIRGDVTAARAEIAGKYLGAEDGARFAEQRTAKPGVLLRLDAPSPRVWDLGSILPSRI